MRIRHRIPMIFSLSMMDVFCCTLGCVILLWLVNQREAMKQTREAATSLTQLKLTRGEREALRGQLIDAERAVAKYRDDLAAVRAQADDTADRLAKKIEDEQALVKKLSAAVSKSAELEVLVRQRDDRLTAAARRTAELGELLDEAQDRAAALKSTAEMVPGLKQAAGTAQDQLAAADARIRGLEGDLQKRDADLTDSRRRAAATEGENRNLAGRLARAQAAIENRFEGIALTGRRVIILVDMSGSMELIDNSTQAPSKWPMVAETALKILRSLTDVQQFQVIAFSDQVVFPLGNEGRWLDNDATAPQRVQTALTAIKPKGGTNIYAALEAAFRYRAIGLDTIYFLSDGLPNVGPGLTPEAAKTMPEAQQTEILAKYIRNTLKTTWNNPRAGAVKVRINTVGFFFESPEVGAFLWALSRENDGSFVGMSKP